MTGFLRPVPGITLDSPLTPSSGRDLLAGPAQSIAVHLPDTPAFQEGLTDLLKTCWGGQGTNLPRAQPAVGGAPPANPLAPRSCFPFHARSLRPVTHKAGEEGRRRRPSDTAPRPLANAIIAARCRRTRPRPTPPPLRALPGDTWKNNKAPRRCFTGGYSPAGEEEGGPGGRPRPPAPLPAAVAAGPGRSPRGVGGHTPGRALPATNRCRR